MDPIWSRAIYDQPHDLFSLQGVAITVTGIVLSLLNGCIEAWYAAGYSSSKHGTIYYQTWAAATVSYHFDISIEHKVMPFLFRRYISQPPLSIRLISPSRVVS